MSLELIYENMQIDAGVQSYTSPVLIDKMRNIPTFPSDVPELYHTSSANFETFLIHLIGDDNSNPEYGTFFSGSKEGTVEYINKKGGDAILYTISTDGLKFTDGDKDMNTMEWILKVYLERYPDGIDEYEEFEDEWFDRGAVTWSKIPQWIPNTIKAALIASGIDGCIYDEYYDYEETFPRVYCIWNTDKLKILSKEQINP